MTTKSLIALVQEIDRLEEEIARVRTECEIWGSSATRKADYSEARARLRALEQQRARLQREAFVFMATCHQRAAARKGSNRGQTPEPEPGL